MLKIIATVAVATAVTACQTTQNPTTPIDATSEHEGLQRVEIKGIDAVYRKPGTSLSSYTKLLVRPAEVRFAKDLNQGKQSTLHTLSEADRDRIRQDLSAAFHDVLRRELQTEGGYLLVDTAGPDVLEVRPALVDLSVTVSDVSMQADGRTATYTIKAGEMTLVAELHDSVTGELLSRVSDREESSGSWQWTTAVSYTTEARRIMAKWASTLRHSLDASRSAAA